MTATSKKKTLPKPKRPAGVNRSNPRWTIIGGLAQAQEGTKNNRLDFYVRYQTSCWGPPRVISRCPQKRTPTGRGHIGLEEENDPRKAYHFE